MAGDARYTSLWAEADVYIAPAGTAGPTDLSSAWPGAWTAVGLLDGEDGFKFGSEQETSEHYAWGGLLYKQSRSKAKRSVTFTALEDNDVVFGLVNPGSTRTTDGAMRTAEVKVPAPEFFAVGLETREGASVKRRFSLRASVESVAEITETESEPTTYEITVTLYPNANGVFWTALDTDPASL